MADSEKIENTMSKENTTEDINNGYSSMENAVDEKEMACKTVSNNNWWGSWISSAKTKSVSVFEAVKRDLDEISTAVRTEVSHAGSVIGETLKLDEPESAASSVKKSLSSFFEQVSEALVPSIEDDEAEAVIITSEGAVTLTGFQKHLAELQANDATYLSAPDATLQENYQRWLEIVDQTQFTQNQLTRHLTCSEILNEKYASLVPDKVSHMEFWKRYLFKRALLEDALAHAEMAERRAKAEVKSTKTVSPKRASEIIQTEQPKAIPTTDDDKDDVVEPAKGEVEELVIEDTDIKWDADDFGNEEISEEEQARLLEQYEAEIMEREKRKSQSGPVEEKHRSKTDDKNQPEHSKTGNNKKNPQKTQPAAQKGTNANKKSNTTKPNSTTTKQLDNSKTKTNAKSKQVAQSNTGDETKSSQKLQKKGDTTEVKERSLADDLKDAGAASDESWEKDFDLSDQ